MLEPLTAEIFSAFVYGAAGLVGGGILFEGGKRYVKTAGSTQFKGKVEALPFFVSVLILGWALERFSPVADGIAASASPAARVGAILFASMVLFNYSIDHFRYTDPKSVTVYITGVVLMMALSL